MAPGGVNTYRGELPGGPIAALVKMEGAGFGTASVASLPGKVIRPCSLRMSGVSSKREGESNE